MEILAIVVGAVVVMVVAARFDNGTGGNGQPYSPVEEIKFLAEDTTTDPMYSWQPDNVLYEDHHSQNE